MPCAHTTPIGGSPPPPSATDRNVAFFAAGGGKGARHPAPSLRSPERLSARASIGSAKSGAAINSRHENRKQSLQPLVSALAEETISTGGGGFVDLAAHDLG